MTVINLDRDMRWMAQSQDLTLTQAETNLDAPEVRTDGVLNENHGFMQSDVLTLAGTSGKYVTFGLHMQWNQLGAQPYRLQGFCTKSTAIWGYGWTSAVNLKQAALTPNYLTTSRDLDMMVAIREKSSYADENLIFFCMVPANAGETVCNLSAQRLSGRVDTYTSLVR